MKRSKLITVVGFLISGSALPAFSTVGTGAPNLLTYQGRLQESGSPVTGNRDIDILLCGALTGPGCTSTGRQGVAVSNGLFRTTFTIPSGVDIKFGAGYLEVQVGPTGGTLVVLGPREQATSSLYAVVATSATALNVITPGQVVINDGNQAMGNVLVSSANGVASWQTPAFSSFTVYGNGGPFTVPPGKSLLMVEVWGAGGGGGGGGGSGSTNRGGGGAGGCGGGYGKGIFNVAPGANFTVTVAASPSGGSGGLYGGTPTAGTAGQDGGPSSFGALISAGGGAGGGGGGGDPGAGGSGGFPGASGVGSGNAPISVAGGFGGRGENGPVSGRGGVGGAGALGNGGGGNTVTGSGALAAGGPGGDAPAPFANGNAGGNGAPGRVIVWY